MYHIVNANTLYDVVNELKIELNLYKDKERIDVAQFLDDVSLWMDSNRDMIQDKYLPFCVLSVGIVPTQVSAFMYGMFVGKALEKHKLKIKSGVSKVCKDDIRKEIEKNINYYNGILGDNIKDKSEEDDNGRSSQKPRK
jgi:hypothetical protein